MKETLDQIEELFDKARERNEFEFLLTILNYRHIASPEEASNLKEWFDALDYYKNLYDSSSEKEKCRIGLLLYSTFFENSDFYNIIGSLCLNALNFRGSSYLFWKTKKQDRLLGTGEKIRAIKEKLSDCEYHHLLSFFDSVHVEQIRNTFFHSAYSFSDGDYVLFDSEPIQVEDVNQSRVSIDGFLIPRINKVIEFFEKFKECYELSFSRYSDEKTIQGNFPDRKEIIIHGSNDGLKGVTIKKTAQFYGKWSDSKIYYDEKYGFWSALNIQISFPQQEAIEIDEALTRYESKADIKTSNSEFFNLVDKVCERNLGNEMPRIIDLLIKFGNSKYDKWKSETNEHKKEAIKPHSLPFYEKAVEINKHLNLKEILKRIKEIK